jgi:hypothetical protein
VEKGAKPLKNKKAKLMKKTEGKKKKSLNDSDNEEDCSADQCLKVCMLMLSFFLLKKGAHSH